MNCKEFLSLLPQYPDTMDETTKEAFLAHAMQCEDCAAALADHEEMLATLHTLDEDVEVPEAFSTGWRSAIRVEETQAQRSWLTRWQGWAAAAAVIVMVISGTALMRRGILFTDDMLPQAIKSAPAPEQTEMLADEATDENEDAKDIVLYEPEAPMEAAPAPAASAVQSRTAVSDTLEDSGVQTGGSMASGGSADMEMEAETYNAAPQLKVMPSMLAESATLPAEDAVAGEILAEEETSTDPIWRHSASVTVTSEDIASSAAALVDLAYAHDGQVEMQLALTDSGTEGTQLRLRIPSDQYEAFMQAVQASATVVSAQRDTTAVNADLEDTARRQESYREEEARLMTLLASAEDAEAVLAIKTALAEVQENLHTAETELAMLSWNAAYADVEIVVLDPASQPVPAKPPIGQRLRQAASRAWRQVRSFAGDTLVFLVMAAPYVVCAGILACVVYGVYRAVRYRKNNKKKEKDE